MKKRLIAGLLLAGGTMFAGPRFSFGVNFGAAVPVAAAPAPVYGPGYIPPSPGPNYVWVAGYYTPDGFWVPGYWNYVAPVMVAPQIGFAMHFGDNDHRDFDRRDNDRRDFDRHDDGHRAPAAAHHDSGRGRR